MNSLLALALRITTDPKQALRGLVAIDKAVDKSTKERTKRGVQAEQAVQKAVAGTGSVLGKLQAQATKLADAREVLGVRAERSIQREIRQTEAAYNRLARSGVLSAREQTRAYDAMKAKVKELRTEMEGMSRLQRMMAGGLGQTGRGMAAVGAGVATGAYMLAQPVKRVMDYDRALAMSSNTIFSDQGVAGRVAGMKEIDAAVIRAVRAGGGSRDDALQSIANLAGSGVYGSGQAGRQAVYALQAQLQKYATATGSDVGQLASTAMKANQVFGIKDAGYALDMGIVGGASGGMELRDQARWLPEQMASASKLGMKGEADYAKLIALNQAAFITAGSADGAGNNVRNMLDKMSSVDVEGNFKKLGINLTQRRLDDRAKGIDAIDSFLNVVDEVASKDKRYVALKGQLGKTSDKAEQAALLESMLKVIEGSQIGKIVQDAQASNALVAGLGNRATINSVYSGAIQGRGAGAVNFGVMATTASHQLERAATEKAIAEREAFGGLNKVVGDTAGKLADYAQQYPALTATLVGTTHVFTALAASAGAAGLAGALTGASGSANKFSSGMAGALGKLGALAAAGTAGYAAGSWINDKINNGISSATDGSESSLGGWLYSKVHAKELEELNKPIALPGRRAQQVDVGGDFRHTLDVRNGTVETSFMPTDSAAYNGRIAVGMGGR